MQISLGVEIYSNCYTYLAKRGFSKMQMWINTTQN